MRHLRRTALILAALLALALVTLAACDETDSSGPASTPQSEETPPASGGPASTPQSEETPPASGGPLEVTSIDMGDQSGIAGDASQVFKIETEEEWADFWSRHRANVMPPPSLPTVDFSQQMVIATVDQQRPSGGFQLEITEVEETEGKLVVRVSAQVPGADCIVTAVITQPFHIVSVDRSDLEPELALSEETYSCE